jgi:hypothetical protein
MAGLNFSYSWKCFPLCKLPDVRCDQSGYLVVGTFAARAAARAEDTQPCLSPHRGKALHCKLAE